MSLNTLQKEDNEAIDTVMSTLPLTLRDNVALRLGGTFTKRKRREVRSAAAEVLEIRQMPSGTAIEVLKAEVTDLEAQILQVDAEIASVPSGASLNWKPSSVSGWNGELVSSSSSLLYNSAMTASGKFLVNVYKDGMIEIRDAVSGTVSKTLNTGIGRGYFVVEDPVRDVVYVSAGESRGAVIAVDAAAGTELWRVNTGGWTNLATVSSDGSRVVADVDGKGAMSIDAATGGVMGVTNVDDYAGTALPEGKIASIRNWSSLWIRDAQGREKNVLSMSGMTYRVAVSSDGSRIAVGGAGGQIAMVDVATGGITRWSGEGSNVRDLAFVGNGTLSVAHGSGVVEFFDVSGSSPRLSKSIGSGGSIDEMYVAKGNLIIQNRDSVPVLRSMKIEDPAAALQKATLTAKKEALQTALAEVKRNLSDAEAAEAARLALEAENARLAALALEEARIAMLQEEQATAFVGPLQEVAVVSDATVNAVAEVLALRQVQEDPDELRMAPVKVSIAAPDDIGRGGIVIDTPFDHTTIVTPLGVWHFDHVGGATNLEVFRRRFGEMINFDRNSNPTAMCTVYADAAQTLKVYEIVFAGDVANGSGSVRTMNALPIRRAEVPLGVETMRAPLLAPVGIQGSNITLAVSSPCAGGNEVRFTRGDGLLTREVVQGCSDGGVTPVTLGMNTSMETGEYDIALVDANGNSLSRLRVRWDKTTKQLSLCEGTCLWTGTEAQGKAMSEQMQEIFTLMKDPTIPSGALAAMQRESLLDGAENLGGIYAEMCPDFGIKFLEAHPEWTDEAIHATSNRLVAEGSTFSATQIFQSIVRERNDTQGILRSDYSLFVNNVCDLLQAGLSLLSEVRAGGDETSITAAFKARVQRDRDSLVCARLASIGIHLPSADVFLNAMKGVWNVKCSELVRQQAEKARVEAGAVYHEQLVAKGWVPDANGQMVAASDPRATTGLKFYVDSQGRETLLAQGATTNVAQAGVTYGLDLIESTTIVAGTTVVNPSVYESIQLKLTNGEYRNKENLTIQPERFGEIVFDVEQESMVNLWTEAIDERDISLTIKGGPLPDAGYTSEKAGETGESISLRLTPGHYTLRVSDRTNYTYMNLPVPPSSFQASVGVEISKFNSAKIEGKVSIPESTEVMPVRMSVAEFIDGNRIVDYSKVSTLNPSKPVWVVVHGMNDSEEGLMEMVSRELTESQMQVVMIDWHEAADTYTTTDAPWTKPVGEWIASQLIGLEFSADNINVVGHSHGTYVAYACARKVIDLTKGSQINALVALDPAGNVPAFSGFTVGDMNFAQVSQNSLAIEGSWMAGNDSLASTADVALKVDTGLQSLPIEIREEHSLVMPAFANMLKQGRMNNTTLPANLLLSQIMTPIENQAQKVDRDINGEYEGTIFVHLQDGIDAHGKEFMNAIPADAYESLL